MSILLKGTLRKWGGLMKGWSKKYFILKEDCLEFYPSHKKLRNCKKIDFKHTEIIEATRDQTIQLSCGKGIISIKFSSEKEKSIWLRGIQNSIEFTKMDPDEKPKVEITSIQDAEMETIKRKSNLDNFKEMTTDKIQMLRESIESLRNLKGINKKKAKGFIDLLQSMHLQVNDIERLCLNNADHLQTTMDAVQDHIRQSSPDINDLSQSKFFENDGEDIIREATLVQGVDKLMSEEEKEKNQVKQSMRVNRSELRNNALDSNTNSRKFDYEENKVEDKAVIKLQNGINGENIDSSNSSSVESPSKANALEDEEDEEEKLEASDDEKEDLEFYDAIDYMLYDELEKSVYEMNKRRQTVLIHDHKRTTLPALKPKASINIFKILKDSIGKDLTKF
jgi:hypothetical protein